MKSLANIITLSRAFAAIALLFLPVGGPWFWVLYAWCGVSDMLDGPLARKAGTASQAGARLDSLADLVFAVVCLIKILPALHLELWLFIWIILVAVFKIGSYIINLGKRGDFESAHSLWNKMAGFIIFVSIPLVIAMGQGLYVMPACVIATIAAIQDFRASIGAAVSQSIES